MPLPKHFLLLLIPIASLSCSTPAITPDRPDVELVSEWMTGSFSSETQATRQPDDFYDIRLFMVGIWNSRQDGSWLYVEQAAASALERPYRQRVYHLVNTPAGPRSDVYELPGDPLDYAGAWQNPATFESIGPDDLRERSGCSIHLQPIDGTYKGSTRGLECVSRLRGSAYATSEVVITTTALTSWDRGFDDQGKQV